MAPYDGVVLAGGSGQRMGTSRKPSLTVGGRSMLAASVAALAGARRVVVVGPQGDLVEQPPGGGPVAALAAALERVDAAITVVLAADLPFVTTACVERLVAAAPAVARDGDGRAQYLLAAYLTADLRGAIPTTPTGAAMRAVVATMSRHPAMIDLEVGSGPPPWWDCDTPDDLATARRLA